MPPKGTALVDLINHYKRGSKLADLGKHLNWFKAVEDKRIAVGYAASARCNGIKLSHQGRLSNELLRSAASAVQKRFDDVSRAETFDELFQCVDSIRKQMKGLGDLWAYDTALRISVILGKPGPTNVYLQSGAKEGAISLQGNEVVGRTARHVPLACLRPELHRLSPMEVENFLCIYESRLSYEMP